MTANRVCLGVRGGRYCPGVWATDDGVVSGPGDGAEGYPGGEGPHEQGLKVVGKARGAAKLVAERLGKLQNGRQGHALGEAVHMLWIVLAIYYVNVVGIKTR